MESHKLGGTEMYHGTSDNHHNTTSDKDSFRAYTTVCLLLPHSSLVTEFKYRPGHRLSWGFPASTKTNGGIETEIGHDHFRSNLCFLFTFFSVTCITAHKNFWETNDIWTPRWCLRLVAVGFACSNDLKSYADGNVATGRVSQAGQVKSEVPD
jgi:hypothetical protein